MKLFKLFEKDAKHGEVKGNYLIIKTDNGSFHIVEKDGVTEISMYDHFNIRIIGQTNNNPLIEIDSEEYPTRLQIKETENKFEMVRYI